MKYVRHFRRIRHNAVLAMCNSTIVLIVTAVLVFVMCNQLTCQLIFVDLRILTGRDVGTLYFIVRLMFFLLLEAFILSGGLLKVALTGERRAGKSDPPDDR